MATAFLTHPDCAAHDMGAGHPECPGRLRAVEAALEGALAADGRLLRHTAPVATREQLERVHSPGHVDYILRLAPAAGVEFIDGDTVMTPATLPAALRAAGAPVLATELVLSGTVRNAFCNVRPPGHHAERNAGMGFCFFNNVAVGAAHALALGMERVAVLDFDVHHGNGSEDIFAGDPRVLFCSTYQHPFYPGRAGPSVAGQRMNTPLPAGAGSVAFRAAIERDWLPALAAFAPAMVFVSAGFDAHADDPLGGLALREADYAWVTRRIMDVARACAGGRVVSVLEGGYDLPALGSSAAAHVAALLEG